MSFDSELLECQKRGFLFVDAPRNNGRTFAPIRGLQPNVCFTKEKTHFESPKHTRNDTETYTTPHVSHTVHVCIIVPFPIHRAHAFCGSPFVFGNSKSPPPPPMLIPRQDPHSPHTVINIKMMPRQIRKPIRAGVNLNMK